MILNKTLHAVHLTLFPNVTKMDLSGYEAVDDDFLSTLQFCDKLEVLNLSSCRNLNNDNLQFLNGK